jgi:hypothetical protein
MDESPESKTETSKTELEKCMGFRRRNASDERKNIRQKVKFTQNYQWKRAILNVA